MPGTVFGCSVIERSNSNSLKSFYIQCPNHIKEYCLIRQVPNIHSYFWLLLYIIKSEFCLFNHQSLPLFIAHLFSGYLIPHRRSISVLLRPLTHALTIKQKLLMGFPPKIKMELQQDPEIPHCCAIHSNQIMNLAKESIKR